MEILSYLVALPAALIAGSKGKQQGSQLPTFKPRFWYSPFKLDARPVAWSLRNRPEEWAWKNRPYVIVHKPSGHVFWVGNGWGFYRLYDANCSCNSAGGRFQRFQQGVFHRAYRQWRAAQMKDVAPQFAKHFIH